MSAASRGEGLSQSQRLIRPAEFAAVYARGRKAVAPTLILWSLATPSGGVRLGVVASRRVGGAVVRNRARRLLREAFRRHRADWTVSADVVIVARRPLAETGFREVEADVLRAARRAGLGETGNGENA